ncbi:MAG: hypothetical protein ACE5IJ_10495 [Thermoplasmata archaeon]
MVSQDTGQAISILMVGFFMIQGLWLAVLTYFMFKQSLRKVEAPQKAQIEASSSGSGDAVIEDLFLLDRGGLLMRHLTRLKPQVDPDILTGMFRAVQEFVRDSFRAGEGEEEGELHELAFGELKISLCSGRYVVLASVIRGANTAEIRDEMIATIRDLEEKRGDSLRDWDGHMRGIDFVDGFLGRLLDGGYRSEAVKGGMRGGIAGSHQEEIATSE